MNMSDNDFREKYKYKPLLADDLNKDRVIPKNVVVPDEHIISLRMPKLSISADLKRQTTTLHIRNQVERKGKSRWSFITGEETQYALQKQNLIRELNKLYDKSSSFQTAEMWLQREAAASLIPDEKPTSSIDNTLIGAFAAGFTGSKTKTRFEEFYKAWRAEALKSSKTYYPHATRFEHNILSKQSTEGETLVAVPTSVLLKKSSLSTALEEKTLFIACTERIEQLQSKQITNSTAYQTSIALLLKLGSFRCEVSANDWLNLTYAIENHKDSPFYGAFKDKRTREIFDAAETGWHAEAIKQIQQTLKSKFNIDPLKGRSSSQISFKSQVSNGSSN